MSPCEAWACWGHRDEWDTTLSLWSAPRSWGPRDQPILWHNVEKPYKRAVFQEQWGHSERREELVLKGGGGQSGGCSRGSTKGVVLGLGLIADVWREDTLGRGTHLCKVRTVQGCLGIGEFPQSGWRVGWGWGDGRGWGQKGRGGCQIIVYAKVGRFCF